MAERLLVAVLAAGEASRFGGGKLDALCAGKPLGRWCLDTVTDAKLAPGIVICGERPPAFLSDCLEWRVVQVMADAPALSLSLKTAVSEAVRQEVDALLVVLADMPAVSPDHLHALAECEASAATLYPGDKLGVPAKVSREMFDDLLDLSGDCGAGRLLTEWPGIASIAPDPETLLDVDTPGDLARAEALLAR